MPPRDDRTERPLRAGTVTRLVAQKRKPERVSVFIDGTFAFGVHVDILAEHRLTKGQALGVEEQRRILTAEHGRAAKVKALDYIGYKPRTTYEVRRKLERSGFESFAIENAIARLRELNYLDDAAYARSYAEARFRSKGYGPKRIRSDLMRRGVDRGIIERVTAELAEQKDMLEAARDHAEKRWRRFSGDEDRMRRRKKLSDYLARRGFSFDTIRRVVDELEQRAET